MQPSKPEHQRSRRRASVSPAGVAFGLAAVFACTASGWGNPAPPRPSSDAAAALPAADPVTAANQQEQADPEYRSERIRGRITWLADALAAQFGISTVPEVRQNAMVLLTEGGELIPIVEDARGRAFRKDERLRKMDLELLVRRYQRHPYMQILRVYEVVGEERFEIDYWCDVCAIVMYEAGPCACCQADNRLRKRKVETP